MEHGLGDVGADRARADAQFTGDFLMGHAAGGGQHESPGGLGRQTAQHGVDLLQRLQHDVLILRRRRLGFGQYGQRVEPGALDFAVPPQIDAQAVGDDTQVGPRLRLAVETLRRTEQADKSIVRQIGRLRRATQPPPQPALQPVVIVVIQELDRRRGSVFGGAHRRLKVMCCQTK